MFGQKLWLAKGAETTLHDMAWSVAEGANAPSPVQILRWRLHYLSTEALEYSALPRFSMSATAPDPSIDLSWTEDDHVDSAATSKGLLTFGISRKRSSLKRVKLLQSGMYIVMQ